MNTTELLAEIQRLADERDALRQELDALKKTTEKRPMFEVGKSYRTRGGGVGTIEGRMLDAVYPLLGRVGSRKTSWTEDGLEERYAVTPNDLLPGEVIAWQPPASLPDGVYRWLYSGDLTDRTHSCFHKGDLSHGNGWRPYKDWTDPPKFGTWRVRGGVGVWEGE